MTQLFKHVGPLLAKRRAKKAKFTTLEQTDPVRQRASTRPTKKCYTRALALLLTLLAFNGCRPGSEKPELTIYAAASLTELTQALGAAFDPQGALDIRYNFAGSGALAQQLIAAPQADLFLSANPQWVQALEAAGRVEPGQAIPFLSNRLCLIAHPSADWQLESPAQLLQLDFEYLALGDPGYVPAGQYARQWLESISGPDGRPLWPQLQPKALPTSDVRAVIGAVAASAKVIGIVYQSDYLAAQGRVQLLYRLPESAGPAIHYLAAPLNARPTSREFARFLSSPAARAIYASHGFTALAP